MPWSIFSAYLLDRNLNICFPYSSIERSVVLQCMHAAPMIYDCFHMTVWVIDELNSRTAAVASYPAKAHHDITVQTPPPTCSKREQDIINFLQTYTNLSSASSIQPEAFTLRSGLLLGTISLIALYLDRRSSRRLMMFNYSSALNILGSNFRWFYIHCLNKHLCLPPDQTIHKYDVSNSLDRGL